MLITSDFVKKAIASKHSNYSETCKLANELHIHADGAVPEELINERRPSETEDIKKYRKKIYVPITQNPIAKVINSLEKIRRSQDWSVQYDDEMFVSSIAKNETLQEYCEYNYPVHTSVTNWAFAELLKQYLLDANGVVAVIPKEKVSNNEYVKPIAVFFESKQVIEYVEDEYAVLKSIDTSEYTTPAGKITYKDGDVYYVITKEQVLRYEQTSTSGDLTLTLEYNHNIGRLPAFKAGGLFLKRKNNDTIYVSRISSMLPNLNEAAREYSDLQAEIVQHIHSEKYAYADAECKQCRGTGKMTDGEHTKTCQVCDGHGNVLNVTPYGMHLINVPRIGEYQLPTPPIGYVQKSVEIARLQDERVKQHIYDALASLNMEFLANTPLSQSGVAKEVDKDELNNFVNGIAEDIVRILDNVYFFINEYRYMIVVPNREQRISMLPSINVPTKYDILSSQHLISDLTNAETAKVNPVIRRTLEIEYAKKKFNTDPNVSLEVQTVLELDPLYGLTEDEKMVRKSNGAITETDYIISCNIVSFVRRAVENNKAFYSLSYEQKREAISKLADELKLELNKDVKKIDWETGNGVEEE